MNMQKIGNIFFFKGAKLAAKVRQVILTKQVILYAQNWHTGVFSRSFQATYLKKLPYNPPRKVQGSLRA
jgi:hypothetical protein